MATPSTFAATHATTRSSTTHIASGTPTKDIGTRGLRTTERVSTAMGPFLQIVALKASTRRRHRCGRRLALQGTFNVRDAQLVQGSPWS